MLHLISKNYFLFYKLFFKKFKCLYLTLIFIHKKYLSVVTWRSSLFAHLIALHNCAVGTDSSWNDPGVSQKCGSGFGFNLCTIVIHVSPGGEKVFCHP